MNVVFFPDFVQRLGWTLVHFIWQGVVIAALLAVSLKILRRAAPNRRYVAGCVALLLLGLAPVATMWWLAKPHRTSAPRIETTAAAPAVTESTGMATKWFYNVPTPPWRWRVAHRLEDFLPWMVVGWLAGVAALSCRLAAAWLLVNRLRRVAAIALDAAWQERLEELKARLGISRPVRLVQSLMLEVPTVIGWLKPMILLPAGCLAGLSPEQLESIIAHELAHIRRHDYLVNLVQGVVETLLFYHPAVWWVSRQVREERELCCDDLAVEICGDRVNYACALATLEEMRAPVGFALGANGGVLLPRIMRLAGKPDSRTNRVAWPLAGIIILLLFAIFFVEWRRHRIEIPRFHPLFSRSFMVNTEKFPQPLRGTLQDVRMLSHRNDSGLVGPAGLRNSIGHGMWTMVSQTGGFTSSISNPTEAGKTAHNQMLKFFADLGVDFDANKPINAGKEFTYSDLLIGGSLMVRASSNDLVVVENALKQMDAFADNTTHLDLRPPNRWQTQYKRSDPPNRVLRPIMSLPEKTGPNQPSGVAHTPGSLQTPAEVTAAILAAQQQAAANAPQPFPPVPPPLDTAPPTFGVDPHTGLPVPAGTPISGGIDPKTGIPSSPNNPSAPRLDFRTGLPFPTTNSAKQPDVSQFETRMFHVDPQTFAQQLKAAYKPEADTSGNAPAVQTKSVSRSPEDSTDLLRAFFTASGADFSTNNPANASKMFVWNDRKGIVMVHATTNDLNAIEKGIEKLTTPRARANPSQNDHSPAPTIGVDPHFVPAGSVTPNEIDPATGLAVSTNDPVSAQFDTCMFHVDSQSFVQQLEARYGSQTDTFENIYGIEFPSNFQELLKAFFSANGADFTTTNAAGNRKMFTYTVRKGVLMVRSTTNDLDAIGKAIEKLTSQSAPASPTNNAPAISK